MSIIFHIDVNSEHLSWTTIEELKEWRRGRLKAIPAIIERGPVRHGVVLANVASCQTVWHSDRGACRECHS